MDKAHAVPQAYEDPLLLERVHGLHEAAGSADLFPETLSTLQPEMVQSINTRALLLLGHIGVDHAFKTLDDWLRFPYREERMLRAELEEDPTSVNTAVQMAARYIVKLQLKNLEPKVSHIPDSGSEDPNTRVYRRFEVYTSAFKDMQLDPQEKLHVDRVRIARLSIRAAALYRKETQT